MSNYKQILNDLTQWWETIISELKIMAKSVVKKSLLYKS